jgi:hypothetical protein
MGSSGLEKLLDEMELKVREMEHRSDDLAAKIGPQHKVYRLTPDLIIPLVGEKGEAIASLQERSGAVISAKIDGEVQIYAPNPSAMEAAMLGIRAIEGTDLEEGQSYYGKVHEILDYGAVLEMTSGARHLLPLGEITAEKLRGDIRDILTEGQVLKVKCLGRDNRGLVVLSCWRQHLSSSLSGSWKGSPDSSPSSSGSGSGSSSSPSSSEAPAAESSEGKEGRVQVRVAKLRPPVKAKKAPPAAASEEHPTAGPGKDPTSSS